MNTVLPDTLIALRKRKGKNQTDAAKALGIPVTTYSFKERKGQFTDDELQRLSQLLEVDPSALTEKAPVVEGDYRDKYIQLLEQQVALMPSMMQKLEALQKSLTTLENSLAVVAAVNQSYQEYVIGTFWQLQGKRVSGKDILIKIERKAFARMQKYQREGIRLEADT